MIEREYQTFRLRFLAGIVDAIVFSPIIIVLYWVIEQQFSAITNLIFWVFFSLSYYVYSVLMHGLFGQTLGKMLLKVKVFSSAGEELGIRRALLRDSVIITSSVALLIIETPDILMGVSLEEAGTNSEAYLLLTYADLIWFLAEFSTMLTNKRRRAVHDYIAGSVVKRLSDQVIRNTPSGNAL